jgi:hypothetical protein
MSSDRLTLAELQVPPQDEPSSPGKTSRPPPCLGCRGPAHGSVGGAFLCLEGALTHAREELADERARHKATREILAAYTSRHRHQAEPRE